MNIGEVLLRAMFWRGSLFRVLTEIMRGVVMRQQEKKGDLTVNRKAILLDNSLELLEAGFFRGKDTVSRVRDSAGNHFILKTGGIDSFQVRLFRVAKSIESRLRFKVPAIIKHGEGWFLMEEVAGHPLSDFYGKRPGWSVEMSKIVADDYQWVIAEALKSQSLGDLLADGQKWLFSRLGLWSRPIIDAGLIDFSLVQKIEREFREAIARKGEAFFGWSHGNIIGDHVFVSGKDLYLLDLNAVPRAGRGYHDFLRALDFLFLKSSNEAELFKSILAWIRQYLSEFDENEVKLVLAFRCIGILGWDILEKKVEYLVGDAERKKQFALRFIKREW